MKMKVLLVGLLLAVAESAFAAGPYVGVSGGVSITHDADLKQTGFATASTTYNTGYGINASLGYNAEPVRFEFEFGYKNADMDNISAPGLGTASAKDTSISVTSYMVNAFYGIKTNSGFTPYFGAGIGLLDGDLKIQGSKYSDTELGLQAIVGLEYKFNNNLGADISYRYLTAPSDFTKNDVSIEYASSNIMFGLRYYF